MSADSEPSASEHIDAISQVFIWSLDTCSLINMDVQEAIRNRRSIRAYKDTPVEREKLDKILAAGRWAPSASNKQPWHFIVVQDDGIRKRLANVHPYGRFMAQSPVVIVALGEPDRHPRYHLADPHQAVQNMLLAAYAEGLGTCWMGVRDTSIEPKFREILDIPEDFRVICSVSLGYPDQERTSNRRDMDEIVSWGRFGK
jgi:nitroreductase